MSLLDEIPPYIDGNGLVSPGLVPPGVRRGSDNGPMYTSEYLIMLYRNMLALDVVVQHSIGNCVGVDHELHRAPGDMTPDEVDDHYGVLSLLAEVNVKPFFKLPIRLWRQPQLLYAYLLAKGVPSIFLSPLNWYTAIVIATSCIGRPTTDTDSRRLSWHLIQATKRKSLLCKLASYTWYKRLHKDYANGMLGVAALYYADNHPFTRWWKE